MKRTLAIKSFITVLTAIIIYIVFLNHVSMLVAHTEKTLINLQIGSLKRLVSAKIYLNQPISLDPNTWVGNDYSFFKFKRKREKNNIYIDDIYQIKKGEWSYSKSLQQLIYRVKEP